ncbi:MAG TPA: AAA family ATPase, partial [Blastocatellia bacterium]|nr:AAA family ATPase [Blastocatellia bacterium]
MSKAAMPPTPYKGLIPYSEEDAPFFFGREPEREIITANLKSSRLTLLYGPSGVGKSSVLRAGVAHHLRQLAGKNLSKKRPAGFAVVVFSDWRDSPTGGLIAEVQKSIARTLGEPYDRNSTYGTFSDFLETAAERIGGRLLIILDQFEEYFLYNAQEERAGSFDTELANAINKPGLPVNFLISLREDALAKLDRFEGRIPNLFDNYLRINHLDRDSAREAIIKPLEQYNYLLADDNRRVSIEAGLVEEVLDQVKTGQVVLGEAGRGVVEDEDSEGQVETPFLQLVMTRLWNEEARASSRVLRLETLNALGGAERIIRTHLDEAMSDLTVEEQDVAARIFRYLVTPSGTKIAYPITDLADYGGLKQQQLAPVIEELSSGENRILRPVSPPPDNPGPLRYEIFHDVLAPAILDWRGRYAQAQERADTKKKLELEEKERAKAEAQLAREQALSRRQRFYLLAMAVLLVLMFGAVAFAFQQRNKAEDALLEVSKTQDALRASLRQEAEARTLAEAQTEEAKRQTAAADEARNEAEKQRLEAEQSRTEAVAQGKAAESARAEAEKHKTIAQDALKDAIEARDQANTAAREAEQARAAATGLAKVGQSCELSATATAQSNTDPELAVLLATEASNIARTAQSEQALRQALLRLPVRAVIPVEDVTSAAFSPDGKLIVTASLDGTARVLDAKTGQNVRELRGHTGRVYGAAFSPDGKLIITASTDKTARVWDAGTGHIVKELT